METFTIEKFAEALNERFILRAGPGEELDLKLVAVQDLTPTPANTVGFRRKPFSARFRGPRTPWARQHTYSMENERLGEMQIFVVPLGLSGEEMVYEAIFS